MNIQELTNDIKDAYGTNLVSVILYGSAADGEFNKGHSDHNTIIVLSNTAPMEIGKAGHIIKKWTKKGNPPPLFFNPDIIRTSADVFPIEFLDIKERHKALFGNDPFANIEIDPKNLRHQCEHELRSKLITLYSQFSLISDSPKKMIELILSSSSSFFAIFKGVLHLQNSTAKASKRELIERLSAMTGSNMDIFFEIIDVRAKNIIWRNKEALEKFEQYLTSIESMITFVDKI